MRITFFYYVSNTLTADGFIYPTHTFSGTFSSEYRIQTSEKLANKMAESWSSYIPEWLSWQDISEAVFDFAKSCAIRIFGLEPQRLLDILVNGIWHVWTALTTVILRVSWASIEITLTAFVVIILSGFFTALLLTIAVCVLLLYKWHIKGVPLNQLLSSQPEPSSNVAAVPSDNKKSRRQRLYKQCLKFKQKLVHLWEMQPKDLDELKDGKDSKQKVKEKGKWSLQTFSSRK